MRLPLALLLALVATTLLVPRAYAIQPDIVVVPWGSWLADTLAYFRDGAVIAATAVVGVACPKMLRLFITDRMIAQAVDCGLANVEHAVAGKVLDVHVANAVLAEAERCAVEIAPKLAKVIGAKLRPLLLARLSKLGAVPPEAHRGNLAVQHA